MHYNLSISLNMQPLSQVCERERSGRALQGSTNLSKCQERLSQPGHGVFIPPFPLLAVMSKMRTSRTVRNALADCPRLNSNGKNAKSTAVKGVCWARRTVRQDPADALSTRAHPVLSSFEVNNGPSALDPRTVCPEANFVEKLCPKPQILIKSQKPADCPPKGPDCPPNTWKLFFLKIFNETLLPNEIATHLNAMHANSWSKWHYGKPSQWNWPLLIVRLSILSIQSFSII
jgi:hypothetical protein